MTHSATLRDKREFAKTCDFCGCGFNWSEDQKLLDAYLRTMGFALGACCESCDDKIVRCAIASERKHRKAEYDRKRRERNA